MSRSNQNHERGTVGLATVAAVATLALSAGGALAVGVLKETKRAPKGLPTPRIGAKPAHLTDLRWAYFTFRDRRPGVHFQCALDNGPFRRCPNHVLYGLVEGRHSLPGRCKPKRPRGAREKRRKRSKGCPRRASGTAGRRRRERVRGGRRAVVCAGQLALLGRKGHCTVAFVVGVGKPLAYGKHRFRVRALKKGARPSKAARYTWVILTKVELEAAERHLRLPPGKEPTPPGNATGENEKGGSGEAVAPIVRTQNFLISGSPSGLLSPGGPALPIPLKVFNPNPVPIEVVEITVSVVSSPPGCAAAENLRIVQSNVSPSNPLRVGAGGSASLPGGPLTAPTVALLNLPVNQDSCKNATFPLRYSGSART